MANGFLTSSPGARHGNSTDSAPTGLVTTFKFTCPGTGKQELSEIGIWVSAETGYTTEFRLSVFTHDATNNCPEAMVANSESAELSHNSGSLTKKYHTYSTKPVVTGGQVYWLCLYYKDSRAQVDTFTTGGNQVYKTLGSYPTWFTGDEWHDHVDDVYDNGIYVVYSKKTTVTVKPSGGDYASLNAALSGEAQDLTTLASILTIECYAMEDTTAADTGTGWTTSSSYYLHIKAAESHGGKWSTGAYRLSITSGSGLFIQANYVNVTGLQISITASSGSSFRCIYHNNLIQGVTNLSKLILKGVFSGTLDSSGGILDGGTASHVINIYNTLIYDMINGSNTIYSIWKGYNGTINAYNLTVQNCYVGLNRDGTGAFNATNVGCSSVTYPFNYNLSITQTTCSTSTPTFVDADNDDFHLASGDTTWRGQGMADPGSGLFSDDIDGNTRPNALKIDLISASGSSYGDNPYTHTCSGNNRVLLVAVGNNNTEIEPSSITYNGESLTKIAVNHQDSSGYTVVSLWIKANPASGANTLSINGTDESWAAVAVSFNGAAGTYSGLATNYYPNDTDPETTVSSATYDWVIDAVALSDGVLSVTGSGQYLIERLNEAGGEYAGNIMTGVSYMRGATSCTLTWSKTFTYWDSIGISLQPYESGYWDIGADQYSASGRTISPFVMFLPNQL